MMDATDRQIGNYRILNMLGHGGFADVYLGEHIHLHTQAAIKVLRTQLADSSIEQFRNEARLIAHLIHPHIICGLAFAGYNYIVNRNPPTQAGELANNFISALTNHNYDLAYNDLGSSITKATPHDAFILQAQREDRCYDPITKEQQIGTPSPNSTQVYDYTLSRTKLAQPYHLHVTVSKDWLGNWSITDYNSDAGIGLPACQS